MKTIHKYQVTGVNTVVRVPMLHGARVLHGDCQRGIICVWAEVETPSLMVIHRLAIVGTGCEVKGGKYVNTFLMESGELVFHLYDIGEE